MSLLNGRYRRDGPPRDGRMPAVQLATGRRVEIQRATGSTAELMRLKRALRDHTDVTHPGWVLPLDAGLDDKGLYVVFPDPGGEPLDGLLGRPMPVSEVVEFLRQMGQILGELHIRGQFHGLLRPDCVRRIRAVDGTSQYRVVDLGLINTAFAVFDTEWAAPEATIDAQSDLYVLGHLAVSLLGGRVAAGQQMVPGDAPVGLTRLLMAMCSPERVQRPLSGLALLQSLSHPVRTPKAKPPALPSNDLSELGSESTFDRSLEAMTNQWRPLRRIGLIVLIGGAVMFYIISGIPTGPADVPHPKATTSARDTDLEAPTTTEISLDGDIAPSVLDGGVFDFEMPDLEVVLSPVQILDAEIVAPDLGPKPPPASAVPKIRTSKKPRAAKTKKRSRKRRRGRRKATRRKATQPSTPAKPTAPTTPAASPYERL